MDFSHEAVSILKGTPLSYKQFWEDTVFIYKHSPVFLFTVKIKKVLTLIRYTFIASSRIKTAR